MRTESSDVIGGSWKGRLQQIGSIVKLMSIHAQSNFARAFVRVAQDDAAIAAELQREEEACCS